MKDKKPLIAITMGDPSGIGPEIAVKAALDPAVSERADMLLVGDFNIFVQAALDSGLVDCRQMIGVVESADAARISSARVKVMDQKSVNEKDFKYGQIRAEYGLAAAKSIETAVQLALEGEADAVVTAPIQKESFKKAGIPFPGHTEMLAHLTGVQDTFLMLALDRFRVSHVTLHTSLKNAVSMLTKDKILGTIRSTHDCLIQLGIKRPVIAVCGLNPHAGESGLFGDEEIRMIEPAVKEACAQNLNATGPFPADSIFAKLRGGAYDAVVTMYHDQGGIPMKLLSFEWDNESGAWASVRGVNITLGLPVIRTSVAHGTAFEIAGKGIASERSLIDAVFTAADMADNRK